MRAALLPLSSLYVLFYIFYKNKKQSQSFFHFGGKRSTDFRLFSEKLWYLLSVMVFILFQGCNSSQDSQLKEIDLALGEWEPMTALQLIEDKKHSLTDTSLMIAYDIYELKVLLIQSQKSLLKEKLSEFYSKSYSDDIKAPYQDELKEIEADIKLLQGKWKEAKADYTKLLNKAIENKDIYKEALFKLKKDQCDINLGHKDNLVHWKSIKNIADRLDNDYLSGKNYFNRSKIYHSQMKWDSAQINLLKAEDYLQQANYIPELIRVKDYLGSVYNIRSKYVEAFFCFKEGHDLAKKIGDEYYTQTFNLRLGLLSMYFKDYDKARTYLQKMSPNSEILTLHDEYTKYTTLGHLEMAQENYLEAIEYYNIILAIVEKNSQLQWGKYLLLYDLGKCYYYLNQYDQALTHFQNAKILLSKPDQDLRMYYHIICWIGLIAAEQNPNTSSISNCRKSMKYGLSNNLVTLTVEASECLYKSYQKIGDMDNAFKYMEIHYQLKEDSNQKVDEQHSGFLDHEYATQQKILEKELEVQQQLATSARKQNLLQIAYLSTAFIVLASMALLLFLWNQNKKKARTNALIQQKNQQLITLNQEINQQNETIRIQNVRLKESNYNLENFAAIAAHDIKSPIRTMSSFAGILKDNRDQNVSEKHVEFLGYIVDSAKELSNMVDSLLEFSKLTSNLPPPEYIDLNDLVESVFVKLESEIKERGVELELDIKPLPTIKTYYSLVMQLFINLIENSIKYAKETKKNRISLGCTDSKNGFIHFNYSDKGIGIPEKDLPFIFNMFFKHHRFKENIGSGIGLATCKKIVNFLGGEITAQSTEDVGTTFFFSLKLIN